MDRLGQLNPFKQSWYENNGQTNLYNCDSPAERLAHYRVGAEIAVPITAARGSTGARNAAEPRWRQIRFNT